MIEKKLKTGILAIASMMMLVSCNNQDPAEYNNKIITIINSSQTEMDEMNNAMQANDYSKAKEVGQKWVATLDKCIEEIEAAGDFNGDATLKNAVTEALKSYKDVAGTEYPALIKEREGIANGSITSQDNEQKILESINTKLGNAGNSVNAASAEFEAKISK